MGNPSDVTRIWFAGTPSAPSRDWTHIDSLVPVPDQRIAVREASEIWIDDALAFPWDSIGTCIVAPTTVNLSGLSLLDLAALVPWLHKLGAGDRIVTDDPAIGNHLNAMFNTAGPDNQTPAVRSREKAIYQATTSIIDRLKSEATKRSDLDRVIIKTLTLSDIVASPHGPDFAQNMTHTFADAGPGSVIEVWGIREAPGSALAGAIVAYRLDDIVVTTP